jgi:hypothetical protein
MGTRANQIAAGKLNRWHNEYERGSGVMFEVTVGLIVFCCLFGAAMLTLLLHPKLSPGSRAKETHEVVKLSIGMIVVMSSLVLGLMTASLKKTFDESDTEIHRLGTQMLVLNRTLLTYGPDAENARALLRNYAQHLLQTAWPPNGGPSVLGDDASATLLNQLDGAIQSLQPNDARLRRVANEAGAQLRALFAQHWTIIDQSYSQISGPFLFILVFWLTLCFASFGYNAPRNRIVVVTLLLSAASIAAAIFLIVDLDTPLDGFVRISSTPIATALSHMNQ